jgi:hypothetical protein
MERNEALQACLRVGSLVPMFPRRSRIDRCCIAPVTYASDALRSSGIARARRYACAAGKRNPDSHRGFFGITAQCVG